MGTVGYRYASIDINSRDVLISSILGETAEAQTDFEKNTFAFIKAWFEGAGEFTLQTSGSTGAPKLMQFTRAQMEASARATISALGLQPEMTVLLCLDPRFVAGKMMLVRAFVGQMKIVAREPAADPLSSPLPPIDFAALVPYQLQNTLTGNRERLDQIATVIVGGAPVLGETLRLLDLVRTRVILTYGMTETLSHIALQHLNGLRKGDSFYTLPDIKISRDGRGCLEIAVPWLPGVVVTNDIVEMTSDTSFVWLGRVDNVINTGGVKVSPEAIEKRLNDVKREQNLHGRLIITSLPDNMLGEKVICVIEEEAPVIGRRKSLLVAISGALSKFERPREIYFLTAFPETSSGKVDRLKIRELVKKMSEN